MEQKKTRKDRAIDTKNKIFETAVTLIKNKGYNNVTVSEICQTAGIILCSLQFQRRYCKG